MNTSCANTLTRHSSIVNRQSSDSFFVEADGTGVPLIPCRDRQGLIQLWSSSLDPSPPGTLFEERRVEVRDHHIIAGSARFSQDATVGIQDHGVASPYLIIINANPVAENQKHPIVMRPRGQPPE